jgi:hypothetical protein
MKFAMILLMGTLGITSSYAQSTLRWTGGFFPSSLHVSSTDNYQLRLYGPITGTCPAGFAYVNQSDPASKTYFSALMLAYANGKRVNLNAASPDAVGACRIAEAQISN